MEIKNGTFTGKHGKNHIQGMAVDEQNGWIYYSFTTMLVKTDLAGQPLGSVTGLVGHLGCISIDKQTGDVYGSLEYKHDAIGRGILRTLDGAAAFSDGFYLVRFNGAGIVREAMDAEEDGLMTAMFLADVLADYRGKGEPVNGKTPDHRYGCSGIDGVCLAPPPGGGDGEDIYIAYGVYEDVDRTDNDHQVLLRCEKAAFDRYALPLRQSDLHRSGPASLPRYFIYTGNTAYGVQNLEYDPFTNCVFMAVYRGRKPGFPNRDIYAADWSRPAQTVPLRGLNETGLSLTLRGAEGPESDAITGWTLPFGQFGLYARGDGRFYITEPAETDGEESACVYTYRFEDESGFTKET